MAKAVEVAGKEIKNRVIYSGREGHILTFPIKNGELLNLVVFRDAEGKPWTQRQWVVPSRMLEDFRGWAEKCIGLLKVIFLVNFPNFSNTLQLIEEPEKRALFEDPPAPTYFKGNFCLIGDGRIAIIPEYLCSLNPFKQIYDTVSIVKAKYKYCGRGVRKLVSKIVIFIDGVPSVSQYTGTMVKSPSVAVTGEKLGTLLYPCIYF
jgi:hypothetical protein